MAGGIPRGRTKFSIWKSRAHGLLLISLISIVVIAAAEEKEPKFSACAPPKPYARSDVWGSALRTAKLTERECFLIKPVDAEARELDKDCSPPSTYWIIRLQSLDGTVQLVGDVFHIPREGYHQACYRIMDAKTYNITIYLVGTNYAKAVTGRSTTSADDYPYKKVLESTIKTKTDDLEKHQAYLAGLPRCNMELLAFNSNKGRWIKDLWYPNNCRVNRITPKEALQCLDGKRLLVTGDSQMWALFAEFMNFLGKGSRCAYLTQYRKEPKAMASLRAYKARLKGAIPYVPGSREIAVHTTEYGTKAVATYYGTASNGFGVGRAQDGSSAKRSKKGKSGGRSLHITYVSHSDSNNSLFRPWMVDYSRAGALAHAHAPFDYVLATSGLRDLALYDTAEQFAHNLNSEFLPSLRFFVRNMSHVTWLGPWAAQEEMKPAAHVPIANNARGFAIEETAGRLASAWELGWLGMKSMTVPRKDLCTDSAHYSWPVSIATLELWLGSICNPPAGMEPDTNRC